MEYNVYVLSRNDEPLGVFSDCRKAYVSMLYWAANNSLKLDGMVHHGVLDKYVWMDTNTGEVFFIYIEEMVMDDMALLPRKERNNDDE